MPDTSSSDPETAPQNTSVTSVSGGVNVDGQQVTIDGDVVGRDKTTNSINTKGGAYVGGNVNVGSGEFVGHDKIVGYTAEQVSSLLTQISSTFQPKPFDGRCPYLGLDAFSEDDADRFFGRETLVSELVARVKESRFVVIAGPSGSGKSSLVRAGLVHTLKQGALPNSDRWLYTTLTPGRDPIESLALAMSRATSGRTKERVGTPQIAAYLRERKSESDALNQCAQSLLDDRPDQRAVIFVDQFEEVFAQVSKEDERAAFLNLLTNATTLENGRVTVLFALRSDFVSNCATYPQLNALLNQQFMQVGAMQPDELVSAIARPALQVGLRIDPDLVAQIVTEMKDEPGALPLMQFALKDLFDAQQAKGGVIALTLNDYLARGGLRKALERHADAAFSQLEPDEQQLARTIFSRLIGIERGMQDTRRTAVVDELAPANGNADQVKEVVQKLIAARLITTDESSNGDTVTISHERLIEAWPWLRRLVNEHREEIALQNRIEEDARQWEDNQYDPSYLYTGLRWRNARSKLEDGKIVLGPLASIFISKDSDRIQKQLRIEEAAREWSEHHSRDSSYLYTGTHLAETREMLAGQEIELSSRAMDFIKASIDANQRAVWVEEVRRQQEIGQLRGRNRIMTVVGVVALIAMLVAIFLGFQSNRNAETASRLSGTAQAASDLARSEADARATAEVDSLAQRSAVQRELILSRSRELAAVALLQMNNDLERGLLIAVEAGKMADTPAAQEALRRLLLASSVKPNLGGQERTEDLIALAKTRVTRELTCEERAQYLHEDVVCATPTPTP